MAIQFLLGGNNVAPYVDLESIIIENSLLAGADTLEFDLTIHRPTYPFPYPQGGNEVVVISDGIKEFGGVLLRVREKLNTPLELVVHCTCRDYTRWFDRHLVTERYANVTAGSIVRDIVTRYVNTSGTSLNFTTANVQDGPVVSKMEFDNVLPSEAIKQLADTIEWSWYIDFDRDVHFFPIENFVSPLPGNVLDLDNDIQSYGDCEIEEDVSQVKNRIVITGIKVKADQPFQTPPITADGYTSWFSLGYEMFDDLDEITVTVNDVAYPKSFEGQGGQPGDGQTNQMAYICPYNMGVRITPTPPAGSTVQAQFYPLLAEIAIPVDDPDSQEEMRKRELITDGIYSYALSDPGLSGNPTSLVRAKAALLLLKYAYPVISGSFYSYTKGWRPGQSFIIKSAYRLGGKLASGLRVYIQKTEKTVVTFEDTGDSVIKTVLVFADTPIMGG